MNAGGGAGTGARAASPASPRAPRADSGSQAPTAGFSASPVVRSGAPARAPPGTGPSRPCLCTPAGTTNQPSQTTVNAQRNNNTPNTTFTLIPTRHLTYTVTTPSRHIVYQLI